MGKCPELNIDENRVFVNLHPPPLAVDGERGWQKPKFLLLVRLLAIFMKMDIPPTNTFMRLKRVISRPLADNVPIKLGVGILTVFLIVLMFPHPESLEFNYVVGNVWTDKDLIAPFSFPIYRDLHDYERDCLEATRAVAPVFDRHDEIAKAELDSVRTLFNTLKASSLAYVRWSKSKLRGDSLSFAALASQLPFTLTASDWHAFQELERPSERTRAAGKLSSGLSSALDTVYRVGIIDRVNIRQLYPQFSVREGNQETAVPPDRLYTLDEATNVVLSRLSIVLVTKDQNELMQKFLLSLLRPNVLYDEDETNTERKIAEENVPRTIGFVQENERVIAKNTPITEQLRLKLDSYRRARAERASEFSEWKHWSGTSLHVLLVIGLYTVYLFLFRKRIIHDNGKLVLIAILILIETFLAFLSVRFNVSVPIQWLIVVPAASMLLTIIFDSRVAFYGTVTIALLVAGIRGNDYGFALTSLIAGAMGAYTVRDIRNRTQIFRSLIFIFMGYTLPIVALAFEQFDNLSTIVTSITFALGNAICSPVITYGMLILFERGFKVTTDLRLLELADLNQPLLKKLSEEAPGTFHHSLTIGNLAEAAAEGIHANPILARVGGYYHDIGKTLKPEYFVENQVTPQNRHNRLKPRMSALIIQSHIKEGVELGKEYGLPQRVLDFIPQHHGTTLISFFYDKAVKQAARKGVKETINEEDFRYPGPKPQSKEAAIIMLADSVEATTRSVSDLTTQRLRQTIDSIIQQRFVEGQLDECELTLRDLAAIRESFYNILLGIHHQRIVYPEAQETPEVKIPSDTEVVPLSEAGGKSGSGQSTDLKHGELAPDDQSQNNGQGLSDVDLPATGGDTDSTQGTEHPSP